MSDSLRRSSLLGNRNDTPSFLPPDLRSLCAGASQRATGGNVKAIAALSKVPAKRIYAVNEEDTPGNAEMLARQIAAALRVGVPRADALAELYLLNSLFDPKKQEAGNDLDGSVCDLAREAGELLATIVARLREVKASDVPIIEKEAQDVIEICHRIVREAQAKAGAKRMEVVR
jgi:hypothetical protein